MFSVSVLIPLIGYKEIPETIKSVMEQNYENYEILVLRNDITDLPKGIDVVEREGCNETPIRELLIRKKGKGNALNEGIQRANGEVIAVIDADCILEKSALHIAVRHFEDNSVVAVGGRLLVIRQDDSLLEIIQSYEYMKTFEVGRRVFALLGAQCLISGAFGLFRKKALTDVGGYDTDTVGEDMELVLRLQDNGLFKSNNRIVYEPKAVCFTGVPHSFKRLLRQRDRWQRGLLDCLLKHSNMILNPFYGLLGIVVLAYQVMFELFGPIFGFLYYIWPWYRSLLPIIPSLGLVHILFQFVLSIIAAFKESDNQYYKVIKRIPWLAIITVIAVLYKMVITAARIHGMISFHWRRLVW